MRKKKVYNRIKLSSAKIKNIYEKWLELTPDDLEIKNNEKTIDFGDETWTYDNDSEFFSDFSKDYYRAEFFKTKFNDKVKYQLIFSSTPENITYLAIEAPSRAEIEEVFFVIDKDWKEYRLPEPEIKKEDGPKIFIGHGRNFQWRDLKDHLTDKHGLSVIAYETGARAGHTIRDILDDMLAKSSFAILVMTGEDEMVDGKITARPNVIHETGLFQGKLGFSRAIVLLEEGTEEFSNLYGIQQIRFSKGKIRETFGDVLSTIKREFK
ncbi:TIR domain-containing protein [Rufibacter glacialis]|uniref:TIR domain-containing protein n=1 Tax=Rufibacter glacialis TaxID=1259555 RepID=A0A5M8QRC8_9BACT|nr:nucleotide-binding protein [Rufibacter glacialis]KAA6437781.1 hypothetical protein FOE74_04585 [Rufibacter glacialis]GGK56313.1 hypothetical protein GCM10011405_00570 [Rufibacter glacialis]